MDMATARLLHTQMMGRTRTDPTRSAGTLQDVITQHGPEEVSEYVVCTCDLTSYPCATVNTIALGLRIPIPAGPDAYDSETARG